MIDLKQYEFWFIAGSQDLYGEDTLKEVAGHARVMADEFDRDPAIPGRVILKPVAKSSAGIRKIFEEANAAPSCAGIITWMHTFSPSKMWIGGLGINRKRDFRPKTPPIPLPRSAKRPTPAPIRAESPTQASSAPPPSTAFWDRPPHRIASPCGLAIPLNLLSRAADHRFSGGTGAGAFVRPSCSGASAVGGAVALFYHKAFPPGGPGRGAFSGGFGRRVHGTPLFADGLFQNPQGFVKALEKFLKVIREKDHRLPFKATGLLVFAFHDVKVKVPHAVFLHVKKVRSVL
jgi:hypothetical protein